MKTLNLLGRLYDLSTPLVMGIINVTPDSFYASSRIADETELRERIEHMVQQGADILDLGAYSTRPGASYVSPEEERIRLTQPLRLLRDNYPNIPISLDTFRADIARWAREEYGIAMVNDISGGTLDKDLFTTVADLQLPYILMHTATTSAETMALDTPEYNNLLVDVLDYFIERIGKLRELGLHDIIIDPGFGFGKTHEQNYQLLSLMERLQHTLDLPMLVGLSRKRMVYQEVGGDPNTSLNGTTILNTLALLNGANILRVHDVAQAKECIQIVTKYQSLSNS